MAADPTTSRTEERVVTAAISGKGNKHLVTIADEVPLHGRRTREGL